MWHIKITIHTYTCANCFVLLKLSTHIRFWINIHAYSIIITIRRRSHRFERTKNHKKKTYTRSVIFLHHCCGTNMTKTDAQKKNSSSMQITKKLALHNIWCARRTSCGSAEDNPPKRGHYIAPFLRCGELP